MMNTKRYILIFLTTLAVGLIYHFSSSKSTLEDEFDISLKSVEDIDKFDLSSTNGAVSIKRSANKWEIKGQGSASQSRVDAFLALLNTFNVSNPITGSKGQEVIHNIAQLGIQVNAYKGEKPIYQVFFVHNPKSLQGNYIYKPGHKYLVQLSERSNLEQFFW